MQKANVLRLLPWVMMLVLLTAPVRIQADTQQSQIDEVTLNLKQVTLKQLFAAITEQTGCNFLINMDLARQLPKVDAVANREPVRNVLTRVLKPLNCSFDIDGKTITVYRPSSQGTPRKITGVVKGDDGETLPGARISVVGSKENVFAISDINGRFSLELPADGRQLEISYIGFQKKNVNIGRSADYKITLNTDSEVISEVVVNGMYERRKESFTGSTTTFNRDELLQVGNQNLVKSLKNLDPAFQIIEDIELGSNPNAMPNIQLRGETSFNLQGDYEGNANQPLFILDGFETTLEKVIDLDMNRVQSVTLLKDAAAKAIYGSKAGNGVVVIETIRPKSGEMRISYNGNLNIETPDLSGYDLMNAKEKYDWEVAHHKYDNALTGVNPSAADLLHKTVYDAIASGTDTYWLSKPLRNGVGQRHALQLEGGDSRVRYILGLSYNNVAGVMKESSRNTFNINSTLSYTYKNMVFRNQMDYSQNNAKNSPYGSFSQYVGLEPYFAPYDEYGNVKQLLGYQCVNLDGTFAAPVYNPLYNATLNTKDQTQYTAFTDNFDMDWRINEHFRFVAKFSYTRQENQGDIFYPSSHTRFIDYDANGLSNRKGLYTKTNGVSDIITSQAGLSYNQSFGKHSFFFNGTWNLRSQNNETTNIMAEGFGNDSMDHIAMATSYYHDSHPYGSDSKTREIGLIGAMNYSYDDRYLFDASYRATGSSVYGSDNHWGSFWSLGAGWNLHKEPFFPAKDIIKLLKLRYSLGYTGTQNFNPYQAHAKYQYGSIYYDGRPGTVILGLPNTTLKWQKVYDNNFGIDLALGSFLTARAEYYIQNTDNMLTDITLPSSTGFSTYKDNMGEIQNRGVELALSITPWRNNEQRAWITFSATGYHNKNKITKIYDIFKKFNEDADKDLNWRFSTGTPSAEDAALYMQRTTRPATKFYEGCSMTAIWGVRSLGIDPMTGNEIYLDKDDNITYSWNVDDQMVIGDSNPKWRGTLGLNAGYMGFTCSLVASYRWGGDIYNTTLIDRVENVTGYGNMDKRVFDTWTQPGDHSPYRQVLMLETPTTMMGFTSTKPTSRFVQKNNELYMSSLSVGYDFYRQSWLRKVGLQRLKLDFYVDELIRLSSIQIERGTSYPFARTFSFSVNATF